MSKKAKTPREIFFQSLYDEYNSPGSYERDGDVYEESNYSYSGFIHDPFCGDTICEIEFELVFYFYSSLWCCFDSNSCTPSIIKKTDNLNKFGIGSGRYVVGLF